MNKVWFTEDGENVLIMSQKIIYIFNIQSNEVIAQLDHKNSLQDFKILKNYIISAGSQLYIHSN